MGKAVEKIAAQAAQRKRTTIACPFEFTWEDGFAVELSWRQVVPFQAQYVHNGQTMLSITLRFSLALDKAWVGGLPLMNGVVGNPHNKLILSQPQAPLSYISL